MSKKTRKKSLATRSPRKAAVKSSKPSVRANTKTSKPVSVKKSSAKTTAKAAAKGSPKGAAKAPAAISGRANPAKTTTKKPADKAAAKTATSGAAKATGKSAVQATPGPAGTKSRSAAARPPEPARATVDATPPASTEGLVPGGAAPDFDLPRDGGGRVSLKEFKGRKLVLFFYPRASTPGCTKEAMDFTRLKGEFDSCGTDVIGISADTVKAQDSFRDKYMLKVPLVSDEQQEMLKAYGAWGEKSMYGRSFLGIIRTTVLVDAKGRIARIWRHVKVDGHADEVLDAARSL